MSRVKISGKTDISVMIQICPQKHDIHTEIHPEKHNDNDGKTTVYTISVAVIQIDRKSPGINGPTDCRKDCPGYLLTKS